MTSSTAVPESLNAQAETVVASLRVFGEQFTRTGFAIERGDDLAWPWEVQATGDPREPLQYASRGVPAKSLGAVDNVAARWPMLEFDLAVRGVDWIEHALYVEGRSVSGFRAEPVLQDPRPDAADDLLYEVHYWGEHEAADDGETRSMTGGEARLMRGGPFYDLHRRTSVLFGYGIDEVVTR